LRRQAATSSQFEVKLFKESKEQMKRFLVLSLATAMCLFGSASSAAAAQYRVGTWKTAQTIQPFYYQQYLPASDSCRVYAFTNPADQKSALLAGSLDMCGTTLAHAIYSASLGQPVVVVAALCNKCSALVVKNDGPVHRVADLRGLKIGYVPGSMHEILLRETLAHHGLSPETDVLLTRVDFFDMGLALAGGGIDAFLSGEPFPTLAVDQGYGRILAHPYYDDSVGTINAAMLVTQRTLEENPQMVQTLVRAHALATEFLQNHPRQWLQKASDFGTAEGILEKAASNMELAWRMDDAFLSKVRALGARMLALNVIDRQPDYDRLFDLSFVRRAATELNP
jgi:NitT/TauT family transport system substrate-binding protein